MKGGEMNDTKTIDKTKYFTRRQADEILSQRYPNNDELEHFPLGQVLKTIPDVNESYREHIPRVIEGVNILLSKRPHYIVEQWKTPVSPIDEDKFTRRLISIFGSKDSTEPALLQVEREVFDPFFRLLAVYHDIGKYIIHERHPVVGWHLLKDVYRDEVENKLYPLLLDIPYDQWRGREDLNSDQERLITIFEANIKFHDLFGVMSTGEASLPVMVDLIPLTGMEQIAAKEK